MLYEILLILLAFLLICYKFLTWNFNYWKKRNINGPKPRILCGNFPSIFNRKQNLAYDITEIYQSCKRTNSFVGIFNCRAPQLLVVDSDFVHRIFVNDFKHFHDNEISEYIDKKTDPLFGNNPFTLTGDEWKEKRAEITPGLTISRIKSAFPLTLKVCKSMIEFIEKQIIMDTKNGIDGKDLSLRFTSEIVTDCVMGISANSFSEQPLPTTKMMQNLFQNSWLLNYPEILLGLFPFITKRFKIRFVPKKTEQFFTSLMQQAIGLRKSEKDQDSRVDFLNYMLQLHEKKQLSMTSLTIHMMTFLFDGFETSALAMSHCLLLLGRDIKRQEKLRKELWDNMDKLTDFDAIMELPYLDACIHETLRIFPPAVTSNKVCTKSIDYDDKNGQQVNILKGDVLVLPIYSIMSDEDNYTNAQSFEPERFLNGDNSVKAFREKGLYYGFGDGPRACIGMRFALAQIKAGLIEILKHYVVKVHPKTRSDNKLDPNYFLSSLDGGIYLEFDKVN